jgi:hypothetical protein
LIGASAAVNSIVKHFERVFFERATIGKQGINGPFGLEFFFLSE